jgi:hypothetical protein
LNSFQNRRQRSTYELAERHLCKFEAAIVAMPQLFALSRAKPCECLGGSAAQEWHSPCREVLQGKRGEKQEQGARAPRERALYEKSEC